MEVFGLLVAIAAAATAVARRTPPTPAPEIIQVQRLSLQRPAPGSSTPPSGHDARDLLFDSFVTHPGQGATVALVLGAFRMAEAGYPTQQCDLFDDILEPDCHLSSLFEKRNEAVAGKTWVIDAGDQGDQGDVALGAHALRVTLGALPMVETFQHLLTYNKYGFSAVEIDWDVRVINGRSWILPVWFTAVRARRFRFSTLALDGVDDELRFYADITRPRGDALRPDKWITIRRDAGTRLASCGLMRNCVWPALGKRYAFRDWVIYSDRYGKPLPLATYKDGADDEAKDVASEVIANIGNDVGAIVPDSITVDFKEVKGTDNSKTHGGLIAHCNAEMSKRINGATLSNDSSGAGSYGLGDVHDAVRWEAVQCDAIRLETAFDTQVFARFMAFNGLTGPAPKMKIQVVRDLDPTTRIDVATKFKNLLGGEVSRTQLAQEFGFREPTDAKDSLPGAPMPMPATPQPKTKEST